MSETKTTFKNIENATVVGIAPSFDNENGTHTERIAITLNREFDSLKNGEPVRTNRFSLDPIAASLQLHALATSKALRHANRKLCGANYSIDLIADVLCGATVSVDRKFMAKGEKTAKGEELTNDTVQSTISFVGENPDYEDLVEDITAEATKARALMYKSEKNDTKVNEILASVQFRTKGFGF